MAKISGIVFLHKNYDSDGWNNHKLQKGELGLNLTTYEVRIGTEENQSWNDASVVSCQVEVQGIGKHVLNAIYENGKLTITKGTISYDDLANQPTFKTINGQSIFGDGNITINEASSNWVKVEGTQTFNAEPMYVKVESIETGEYIQLTQESSTTATFFPVYIHKVTDEEKITRSNADLVICAGDPPSIHGFISAATLVEGETDIYSFTTPSIMMNASYTPLTTNSAYLVQNKHGLSPAEIRKTTIIDLTSYSPGDIISNQNILSALNNDYRNVILRITSPQLGRTSLAHANYLEGDICYFTYTAFSLDGGNQIEQGLATISLTSGEFNFFFEECFVYAVVDSQTFEDRLGEISDILATLVEV